MGSSVVYVWLMYFLFCFGTAALAYSSTTYKSCETPKRQSGKCVPIRECTQLMNLLQTRPVSRENMEYLRQSQCGFQGNVPKVCCSLDGLDLTDSPSVQPAISGSATSNLLPNLNECGYFSEDRIFLQNGEAQLDSYQWMALLEYEKPNGRGFHCGGVLINNRYVLTAAHCVTGKEVDKTWKLISVRLGEHALDTELDCAGELGFLYCVDPAITVGVEEKIVHEQYDPNDQNQYHDIALLRLANNISYSEHIGPICLQLTSHLVGNSPFRNYVEVVGWRITADSSQYTRKQKTKMKLQSNAECESLYADKGAHLGADQLCAAVSEKTYFYSGDSGGALMNFIQTSEYANYFAIGVMSSGNPNCTSKECPLLYTNVEQYIPWIISNLKP